MATIASKKELDCTYINY